MLDIENKKYAIENRKEAEYDDDICVLFYKGQKVARHELDSYKGNWIEEDSYFDNLYDFFDDVTNADIELDEEDAYEKWETIWDNLDWNETTKSYRYGNWELICLDI